MTTPPPDFVARSLQSSGAFPIELLKQAWAMSQSSGADYINCIAHLAGLPPAEAQRLQNLASQAWQASQSQASLSQSSQSQSSPYLTPAHDSAPPSSSSGTNTSSENSFEIPTIPGFEVLAELSRGGMGVVLRARTISSSLGPEQEVALKVILSQQPEDTELRRFELESRTLASLDHPNIVRLIDSGRHEGYPYLAMELVEGQTFGRKIREALTQTGAPPPFAWSREVLRSVAEALQYCHERGITHRDLKPDNILIENETNRVVLVDFGLIKRRKEDLTESLAQVADNLTQSGVATGTPAFMAPEQIDPKENLGIGPHTDVWGLAATAYFAFTGQAPYGDLNIANLYKALLTRDPQPPLRINKAIPDNLDRLVSACLQRDATLRPDLEKVLAALAGEHIAGRKTSNLPIIIASLAFTAILLGATLWLVNRDQTPPQIQFDEFNKDINYVSSARINLKGQVRDQSPKALMMTLPKKKKLKLDENGHFNEPFELEEGSNLIKIAAVDNSGNQSEIQFNLTIDSTPPNILVESAFECRGTRPISVDCEIQDSASGLATVEICEIDDKEQPVLPGRIIPLKEPSRPNAQQTILFEIEAPEKPRRVILRATDRAGCSSQSILTIRRVPSISVGAGSKPAWALNHFENLDDAILQAAPDTELVLMPGSFQISKYEIPRNLKIRGYRKCDFEENEKFSALQLAGDGAISIKLPVGLRIEDKSVSFVNLILDGLALDTHAESVLSRPTITLASGLLQVRACELRSSNDGIKVSDIKPLPNRAILEMKLCRFARIERTALHALTDSLVDLDKCEFIKSNSRCTGDCNNEFAIILDQSTSRLRSCLISESHQKGLIAKNGSRLILDSCVFLNHRAEGIILDGDERETTVDFFKGRIDNCGSNRTLAALLIRDKARVHIDGTELVNSNGPAIRLRNSALSISNARFDSNIIGIAAEQKAVLRVFHNRFGNNRQADILTDIYQSKTGIANVTYDSACEFINQKLKSENGPIKLDPKLKPSANDQPLVTQFPKIP